MIYKLRDASGQYLYEDFTAPYKGVYKLKDGDRGVLKVVEEEADRIIAMRSDLKLKKVLYANEKI